MTDREVMQQALEALTIYSDAQCSLKGRNAITALKAALEQQQAEPTPWRDMVVVSLVREGINKHKARELADHFAAQQQAEPFAWAVQGITQMLRGEFAELDAKSKARRIGGTCFAYPLYTTSPQCQWQGLTDEEIEAVVEQVANGKLVGTVQEFRIRFSRAIEAKLKEKNT